MVCVSLYLGDTWSLWYSSAQYRSMTRNAIKGQKRGLKLYISPNFYKNRDQNTTFPNFSQIKGSKLYKFSRDLKKLELTWTPRSEYTPHKPHWNLPKSRTYIMMCQGIWSHERSWCKGHIYQTFFKCSKKEIELPVLPPVMSVQLGWLGNA